MLAAYPRAQLLMIGPVGDAHGAYAKHKLQRLQASGRCAGRLFVYADILAMPPGLKLACNFCLMPSRDEPFGYVDIEFAWCPAVVVGSLRGGLGKAPSSSARSTPAAASAGIGPRRGGPWAARRAGPGRTSSRACRWWCSPGTSRWSFPVRRPAA